MILLLSPETLYVPKVALEIKNTSSQSREEVLAIYPVSYRRVQYTKIEFMVSYCCLYLQILRQLPRWRKL